MAKQTYFEKNFKKAKKEDLKKILERKAVKFYCDHKVLEKNNNEVSLLKKVSAGEVPDSVTFAAEKGACKCTECKRYVPFEPQDIDDIRRNGNYMIAIFDAIKAFVPNPSDDFLRRIADMQLLLSEADELYQTLILNEITGGREYEADEADTYVNGESMYLDFDKDETFYFDYDKETKNKNKNHKNKNKNKNKDKRGNNKKHKTRNVRDFYR